MPASIQDIFGYTYLTEFVQRIKPGLPKTMPEEFWTLKQSVVGDRVAIPMGVGARDLPKKSPYMSPARQANKYDLSIKSAVCMAFNEVMPFDTEFTRLYRQFADYKVEDKRAMDIVAYQTENFFKKFENMRVATVSSVLALDGKIYFDADGNLLPSSSGAVDTFENQVPAGNTGNPGSIFSTWNTSADITTQVLNFKTYALQQTNFPITTAYYGKNVASRLANNTNFQYYLARNSSFNDYWKNTGNIADGVLGLKWVPVQDTYFVDQNGTPQSLFRDNYITFGPDLNGTYKFLEGTTLVPGEINQMGTDAMSIVRGAKEVPGIGSWATAEANPIRVLQYMFDCHAPVFTVPEAWYWVNVG